MADDEPSDVRDLRQLLSEMPAIAADADAMNLSEDIEVFSLLDWGNRTIVAANQAGRPDIANRVREILRPVEEAEARRVEATERRRAAEGHARSVLRDWENQQR